jgi:protein SCO1/2
VKRLARTIFTLALGCTTFAAAQIQSPEKTLISQVGIDQKLDVTVPMELAFRDERGNVVRLGDYFSQKPVVLTLGYYRCPMLCNQVLNGLLKSSQAIPLTMGKDYHAISVSIDPRETPDMAAAKKQQYVARYRRPGADSGWHFLTGGQSQIDQLASTVGYRYQYDERTDQFAHGSAIMVLTPDGRVSRYLYGIEYHPTDLRLALVESSEGKIGSPVDQFLLLCYHYDPATGKYGLLIHRVLKIAGTATMLLLGGFLIRMYRHERRQLLTTDH